MNPMMRALSRRELFLLGLAATTGVALGEEPGDPDVHRQILDLAARLEKERRARFAAVTTPAELEDLRRSLRQAFLRLLDGLPERAGLPAVRTTGRIEDADYTIEKLVYE